MLLRKMNKYQTLSQQNSNSWDGSSNDKIQPPHWQLFWLVENVLSNISCCAKKEKKGGGGRGEKGVCACVCVH